MGTQAAGEAAARRRRAERKAENRAKLLIAAREVFTQKGLGEATVRDIVGATDLASGTFYNYFRDKDDAFRALIEELSGHSRALVRQVRLAPGQTLEQRVANAYGAYFRWVTEERDLFLLFRRNAGAIALLSGPGLLEEGIFELAQDLLAWEEAGQLPHLDCDYLATAAVGAGVQVAARLADSGAADVERAARFCTLLFLGGVRALAERAEAETT